MSNVKILQLNKLDKQVKESIYNKLIEGDYTAEIDLITHQRKYSGCDVLFAKDRHHESDLCVSHFGYNFYFRTTRAIKGTRYKTFGRAIAALRKLIRDRLDIPTWNSSLRIYYKGTNIFNIEL
jgi:cupin superfamily acireductone dioxygenase involved in methionine salvage